MPELSLFVLGNPRLERNGQTVELERHKAFALLIYLAVTGRPHRRDALAALCMQLTHFLAEGIDAAGFELVTEPELNNCGLSLFKTVNG